MNLKNIALFVVFAFFGLTINAQSLASFGLKGKVKSIHEEYKNCYSRNGKAQTKDCSILTSKKQFTKEGYLSDYKDSLGPGDITREKVETPDGWLETVYNNEDGSKIKKGEHYYNKDNLMLRTISFNDIGSVFSRTEYFHDENGQTTKWEKTYNLNGVKEKRISFFDEYGSFSGFEIYIDDVLTDNEKFNITYEFDEKGNWIQSTVITEFSTDIQNRKITYY